MKCALCWKRPAPESAAYQLHLYHSSQTEKEKTMLNFMTPNTCGNAFDRAFMKSPQNVSEAERWGSALAGTALALFGLSRSSWTGQLATVGGAMLIHRGITGHCALYDALDSVRSANAEAVDAVDLASEDSFPASDPPAWISGRQACRA
jgi:Protein of unknown function (DUF2892)